MLTSVYRRTASQWMREDGATSAEYAIMVALIALVIITAVTALGGRVSALFAAAATAF